jgi:Glycosyl hydrolase family 12
LKAQRGPEARLSLRSSALAAHAGSRRVPRTNGWGISGHDARALEQRHVFVHIRGMMHKPRKISGASVRVTIACLLVPFAACSEGVASTSKPDAGQSGGAGAGGIAGSLAAAGGRAQASAGSGGNAAGAGAAGAAGGGAGAACAKPVFVTSDPNGGWSDGGYYVHNNMWNMAAGLGPETLSACSYDNWYVVSNQTNSQGAVKTYPNVHKDYKEVPISSFSKLTSRFAANSPHTGIYNVAYDIWTNGIATSDSTEFMIWTENYKQVPAGKRAMTVTLGGRTYDVWKTSNNHYIAFVPTTTLTSGTLDLLEIFTWTIAQGWLPEDATLGQICFGVEIVSTDGQDAMFEFTDFSITSQ